MRYYFSTIRNGRYLCGNMNHVAGVYHGDSLQRAERQARSLAKCYAKPGDMIVIERASDDRPYDVQFASKFLFVEATL